MRTIALVPDMLFVGTKAALVQVKLNSFTAINYIAMPGGTDGTALSESMVVCATVFLLS